MNLKMLDLFCCAGGTSRGYAMAGFDMTGCDINPQKRYPYQFHQMDWLECLKTYGHLFDCYHASPPCQTYSALKHLTTKHHPALIEPVREALQETGKPYIIENVVGAPLHNPLMLCGTMFGLQTSCGAQLRRHRLFEVGIGNESILLMAPGPCQHGRTIGITGPGNAVSGGKTRTITVVGEKAKDTAAEKRRYPQGRNRVTGSMPQQNVVRNAQRETFLITEARRAMGIDWMVMKELSQAIPPAYTFYLGRQLRREMLA